MSGVQRALVAGGTSSIGGAVVRRLCARGCKVAFTGRNADKAAGLAKDTSASFLPCDARDETSVIKVAERVGEILGGLEGLVIALGALHTARLSETSDDAWDTVIETNVMAPFFFAKACLPLLAEQGGAIVTIGSGSAYWPELELGAYSVSKRALMCMTQILAVECALKGITANCVNPGEMVSQMSTLAGPPLSDIGVTPTPPIGRKAQAEDVAAAVDYFLTVDTGFCTGASLTVDGGLRAALRAAKVRQ